MFCQRPLGRNFTGDFIYNGCLGLGIDTLLNNRTYKNTGMLRPIGKVPIYSPQIRNWLKIVVDYMRITTFVFCFGF